MLHIPKEYDLVWETLNLCVCVRVCECECGSVHKSECVGVGVCV